MTKSNDVDGGGYAQLKFSFLKRVIGTEYARDALDVLLDVGVIETDNRYVVGTKSIGYRLAARYRGQVEAVKVNAPMLAARLVAQKRRRQPPQVESQDATPAASERPFLPVYGWIEATLDRLSYPDDVDGYLAAFAGEHYDYRKLCVESIRHRSSFFTVDEKTGRCFNIVTSTPSELRSRLLLDGEQTTEVDIASAQPLLAATLYPEDCPEKYRYLAAIDADFYLTLNAMAGHPFPDRKAAKAGAYEQIFFGGVMPEAPLWKAFASAFPKLAGHIVAVKRAAPKQKPRYKVVDGRRRRRRGNSAFALLLQKKEADVVIHATGETLRQSGVPFVTVHDSILCRQRDAEHVEAALSHSIREATGLIPRLRAA